MEILFNQGCTRIDTDADSEGGSAFDPPNRESFSNAVCLIRALESVCIGVYPWFYTANVRRSGVNAAPLLQ